MTHKNLKQAGQKTAVLGQLKKTPIIHIAADKAGISRAIYYIWRKQDQEFARLADEAIVEGTSFLNDLAESQVISLMKDKHWPAIKHWLEHNHPKYAKKLQLTGADGEPMELVITYIQKQ